MLARLDQQLFGRGGARLQRVEAHALAGELVLVTLVGFVERADQPRAFVVDLGEIGFDVAQAALRGVQARLGLGQLARQPGGFGARLVERGLLRALLVLGHQQALARGVEIGFERDDALVGGGEPLVEPAVLLAQRLDFAGLLREAGFQVDDLGAAGGDIDGDLGLGGFDRAQQVLRGGEFLAQRAALLVGRRRLLLQLGDLVAQLAVGGAGVVEHRLQADLLGLLGLEGAQRLAHRIGQLGDRGLDGVELADLGVGVEQQIAQRFVVAADLGAERGEQFLVESRADCRAGVALVR